jgi:putative ABC transport system permease protein
MPTRAEFWLSLRHLVRRPLLVIAIVLPLAMATTVSAALFSVADGLLLRPLPFPQSGRLVSIALPKDDRRLSLLTSTLADPAGRSALGERFQSVPLLEARAISISTPYFDRREAAAAQVRGTAVSPSFFEMLGLRPKLGRTLDANDALIAMSRDPAPAAVPVVIGHALWLHEFGGDAGVLGRNVQLAGRTVTVVGIMDAGVKFPGETNVWTPLNAIGLGDFRGFARLIPGATAEQLQAAFPTLDVQLLEKDLRGTGSVLYVFIFGTTIALLLMAWVQVAGLMLARAADRLRELAVRTAMGASTGRLVGLFVADGIWLSLASLAVAWASIPSLTGLFVSWLPTSVRFGQYLQADGRTLAFAGIATVLGVVVISTAPIYLIRRVSPATQLVAGLVDGRRSVSTARRVLVVGQIALTTMLLYVAGLSVHSLVKVLAFDYGFDADRVLVADLPLSPGPTTLRSHTSTDPKWTKDESDQLSAWLDSHKQRALESLEALQAMPSVKAAAVLWDSPIPTRNSPGTEVTQVGVRLIAPSLSVVLVSASQDFVEALGATLLVGESFNAQSVAGRTDVMVINETLARQISPYGWPLGVRIVSSNMKGTVIGVVKDLVDSAPGVPPRPQIFQPVQHRNAAARVAIVRTERDAETMMSAVRDVLKTRFGPLKSYQIRLLAADVDATVVPWRGRSAMLMLVAFVCVPIAILGLSSGLLFAVRTQSREIGIKLALGASPRQARSNVIHTALRLTSIGGGVGVLTGMAIGTLMDHQLFEVSPIDPLAVITVLAVLLALSWCSALVPAIRASRIDPAVVLRNA